MFLTMCKNLSDFQLCIRFCSPLNLIHYNYRFHTDQAARCLQHFSCTFLQSLLWKVMGNRKEMQTIIACAWLRGLAASANLQFVADLRLLDAWAVPRLRQVISVCFHLAGWHLRFSRKDRLAPHPLWLARVARSKLSSLPEPAEPFHCVCRLMSCLDVSLKCVLLALACKSTQNLLPDWKAYITLVNGNAETEVLNAILPVRVGRFLFLCELAFEAGIHRLWDISDYH